MHKRWGTPKYYYIEIRFMQYIFYPTKMLYLELGWKYKSFSERKKYKKER